jgi:hypothetical protein
MLRTWARKGSSVPVAMHCSGSGTLSRMTVIFRPLYPEPHDAETDEVCWQGNSTAT